MEISTPLFVIGIKDVTPSEKEKVRKHIAIEIILKILLGKSSGLFNELYKQNLIQDELDASYEFSSNYAHILIQGQSQSPEKLLDMLKQEIEKIKNNGINKDEFERARKSVYASYIKEYNRIDEISIMFLSDYFKGINSFEYLEEFNAVTTTYVEQTLKNVFKEETTTLSVIRK